MGLLYMSTRHAAHMNQVKQFNDRVRERKRGKYVRMRIKLFEMN